MKKSTVRILAIVLVALMCLSLLPLAAAHAMELPSEMPEIPGFTWMGDHYVETEHIYGEVANEDFLVDASEPGDCETPALYWRSCINRNPFTEERCGVTAETAYQEALQRAANDLSAQKSSGVQHTDSEWQDIWNRTAEEILNRYTFSYGGFGHQWVEVEYQPATCEQNGWETSITARPAAKDWTISRRSRPRATATRTVSALSAARPTRTMPLWRRAMTPRLL